MVAKGQSQELHQVSSTSGSCVKPFCSSSLWIDSEVVETNTRLSSEILKASALSCFNQTFTTSRGRSSEYGFVHTGMRCPHQSCRLMHQSWMVAIQWSYTFAQRSG